MPARVQSSELDLALTLQCTVAWAGESGEEPRLKWWRSDLMSEFGGKDLFRRLLPHTWEWAVLQAVREAARRKDAELRAKDPEPDQILSLFRLGFEQDTRIDARLQELKRSQVSPQLALPGLSEGIQEPFSRDAFYAWVAGHQTVQTRVTSIGRRLEADPPPSLEAMLRQLVGAFAPASDVYPLPHFRKRSGEHVDSRNLSL